MKDDTVQKEALSVLGNRSIVFQQNEVFEVTENNINTTNVTGLIEEEQVKYVAIKKVKMNDFNVRVIIGNDTLGPKWDSFLCSTRDKTALGDNTSQYHSAI